MSIVSKITQLIGTIHRDIDLSTNTLVVGNLRTQLTGSNYFTFAGTLTANRTITMPDANVDLTLVGTAIQKDGSIAFTAAQSMGGFKLTNVADPTLAQDAATKAYADTKIASTLIGAANGVASLDASSLIPITQLPPAALERLVIVANQTARFALTLATVQNGDTVKQTDTNVMYFVKDDTNLGSALGYEIYSAGTASAVAWSGVTGTPTTLAGYGITDYAAAAKAAAVANSITSGITDVAPSQDAVFNALALKANLTTVQANGGIASIVTSAGTTTLTNASARVNYLTGTTTHTVVLPTTSTLTVGSEFRFINRSTGDVTIQTSTAVTVIVVPMNSVTSVKSSSNVAETFATYQAPVVSPIDGSINLNSSKITNLATPTAANDAVNKAYVDAITSSAALEILTPEVAGESLSATTLVALRYAVAADAGFVAGRVYKATNDATSADNFYAIGLANPAGAVSAAGAVNVVKFGTIAATAHGFTVGAPLFLGASGALTSTAPTAANTAVVRVGMVKDANTIDVHIATIGVN